MRPGETVLGGIVIAGCELCQKGGPAVELDDGLQPAGADCPVEKALFRAEIGF